MRFSVDARLAAELENPVAEAAKERPVVRYEDHRAVEVAQRLDEHLLGRQVEVVRGLVEHEKVGRIEEHSSHHEPRLLAARQGPDLLVHVIARELERTGQIPKNAD